MTIYDPVFTVEQEELQKNILKTLLNYNGGGSCSAWNAKPKRNAILFCHKHGICNYMKLSTMDCKKKFKISRNSIARIERTLLYYLKYKGDLRHA